MQADYPGNFPAFIGAVPDDDEPAGTGGGIRFPAVMELMETDLYRSVVGDRVDLDTAGYQLAGRVAADIFFGGGDDFFLGIHQASLVVVKFKVIRIEIGIFRQVYGTGIVRSEKYAVHMYDRVIQGRVIGLELGMSALWPDSACKY